MEQQKLVLSKKEGEDIHQEKLPELRFTDYDKLLVSNLDDLAKIETGDKNLQDKVDDGIYPFFVRSENIERINSYSFDGEAVLIPGDGVNVGKIYHYINGKFDFHQRVYKISDFDKKILGKYVYYYMRKNFIREVHKNSQKASVDSLRLPTIKQMKIKFPSDIKEQQKIVNILEKVDEKIGLLEKKYIYSKLIKDYFLNHIFFKDYDEKWSLEPLGNLSVVKDGTHDSPKYYNEGFPLVTSKNLLDGGVLDLNDVNFISREDYDKINKRSKVDKGDILFGMIGTIGNPVIINTDGFAIKNVALIKEKKELKNTFLIHVLNSNIIKKQFNKLNAGGTQKFIALNLIRNLKVPIPSIEEQNNISKSLNLFDKKVKLIEKEILCYKKFKKGLLQKMFV